MSRLAAAQPAEPPGSPLGYQRGDLYLSAALAQSSPRELNRAVKQGGYSPFDPRAISLGFGFATTFEHVRLGFDAEFTPKDRESRRENSPRDPRIRWGEARGSVMGGPELRFGELFLAPLVGCSIGVDSLGFAPTRAPFLAEALGEKGTSLSRDSITLDFALAADYVPVRWLWTSRWERQTTYAPVVGVRLGYRWQVHANDWYRGSRRFSGGPELEVSGFFARIVLGWEIASHPRPFTS